MNAEQQQLSRYQQFVGKRIVRVDVIDTGDFRLPTLTFDDGTFAQVYASSQYKDGAGYLGLYDGANGNELFPDLTPT